MYKYCIVILLLICLFLQVPSYASPCYSTRMPEKGEFFSGLEMYSLFERKLEDDQGKLRSLQGFLLISYGIFNWLSLDLKIGAGPLRRYGAAKDNIDYSGRFSGGYGFRLKLYEKEGLKFTGGFQHISVHPFTVRLNGRKYKAVLDDWQVSLLGSYKIKFIMPYAGTRLSRTDYINWIDNSRKRYMTDSSNPLGLILGADIDITEKMWLNAEVSFFDSESLAISLNARF